MVPAQETCKIWEKWILPGVNFTVTCWTVLDNEYCSNCATKESLFGGLVYNVNLAVRWMNRSSRSVEDCDGLRLYWQELACPLQYNYILIG